MKDKYIINIAIKDLFYKINELDLHNLGVSDHTRDYLLNYKNNCSFFTSTYLQLFQKALRKIRHPVSKSIFVDYGGGCGILSLIAKLAGFKVVVYNDLYEKSLTDAKIIATTTGISVDHYICGDAEDFVNQINQLNIHPDLICSLDVLEHIYNLESWIRAITKIQRASLIFMTGANSKNPVIACRLKRIHKKSEYQGYEHNIRFNDTYLNNSFLSQRQTIIRNKFPDLKNDELELLSRISRGLRKDDIEKMVQQYINEGKTEYKIDHPTNTCDPYTGSWTEKLIDFDQLKNFIESNDLLVDITNSFYCYTENKILNIIKFFLNQMIRISGPGNLFLSPAVTLEIDTLILENSWN